MADKKVYIVRGSEDGNIGVYTNIKKAYEAAAGYIGGSCDTKDKTPQQSYASVCKEFKRGFGYVRIEPKSGWTSASIELMYLNQ